MNPVKYLITGAGGFLGSILKQSLLFNGDKVIGLGRSGQDIIIDISKPFSFEENSFFDIVIHAAGKAHVVPNSVEEEKEFFQVNFEGTKKLCLAIEQLDIKPKAFIFISTVAVYGIESGKNILENSDLNGSTPYAESKIMAEKWLKCWASKNEIVLGVLRLPLIAGPNPPGNLGTMIEGINSGKYLSIGEANARKSIVLAEDIVKVIPKLSEIGGTYNLTDGYHPSFGELENVIARTLGKPQPKRIPLWMAKAIAKIGDLLGPNFKITTSKLNKITSDLTFDDSLARNCLDWNPDKVLNRLPDYMKR